MDIEAPTLWHRILLIVAMPIAVTASLLIVLSAPEKEVPPVKGGNPGTFAGPWLGTPPIEVTRSPETDGAQEVRVTVAVNEQVKDVWKNVRKVAVTASLEAGAPSTPVEPAGLDDLPTTGIFEVGMVIEWFSGSTRLGWASVGLADPSSVLD